MLRRSLIALLVSIAMAYSAPAIAADAKVAVAANFTDPAKEIAAKFHAATGDTVTLSFGSSGQFVTEIINGAPYDVLLSADIDHAKKAETAGFTVPGSRFTYATGHLVLWSANPALVDSQGKVLTSGKFNHIAIADAKLAPYGLAAQQFLMSVNLWNALQPKLVTGKSIGQTYTFVQTGNAELGFVALSQVIGGKDKGSSWKVPDESHAPITQQAVLLKKGADNKAAKEFLEFLRQAPAAAVIAKYGYN